MARSAPLRQLRPEIPGWFQEIVLRCLESDPAERYPDGGATRLRPAASRQRHLDGAPKRRRRIHRSSPSCAGGGMPPSPPSARRSPRHIEAAPIVMAAVDLGDDDISTPSDGLREAVARILSGCPMRGFACVNVLKINRIAVNYMRSTSRSQHPRPAAGGCEGLGRARSTCRTGRATFHVLESPDPRRRPDRLRKGPTGWTVILGAATPRRCAISRRQRREGGRRGACTVGRWCARRPATTAGGEGAIGRTRRDLGHVEKPHWPGYKRPPTPEPCAAMNRFERPRRPPSRRKSISTGFSRPQARRLRALRRRPWATDPAGGPALLERRSAGSPMRAPRRKLERLRRKIRSRSHPARAPDIRASRNSSKSRFEIDGDRRDARAPCFRRAHGLFRRDEQRWRFRWSRAREARRSRPPKNDDPRTPARDDGRADVLERREELFGRAMPAKATTLRSVSAGGFARRDARPKDRKFARRAVRRRSPAARSDDDDRLYGANCRSSGARNGPAGRQ